MTNGEKIQGILNIDRDCVEVHGENGTMTFTVKQEWWNAEYKEPTTKNDLGVDCISRQIISDYVESHIQEINTGYGDLNRHTNSILRMIVNYIENMPSVTPQEPIKSVLEDIKAEIKRKANSGQWSDTTVYGMQKAIAIIDKYKGESEG